MSITKEQEKSLQNFLLDTDSFHQLEKWTNNFNLFRVLSIEHMEIKHSNILAWLLDPNENHNLGDLFLSEFLKLLVQDEDKPFDILFLDPYNFSVYREESSKKESRMDIFLISQEKNKEKGTIIVIENKIYSNESKGQLQKYKEGIEKKYPRYKKIFVFLTPEGRDGEDGDWLPISYQDIYEILEKILKTHKDNLRKEVNLLLQNYLDVLRRDVMENSELVDLCNKIYKKHKEAIDLIMDYKTDLTKESIRNEIVENLREIQNEGKIIFDEKVSTPSFLVFYTKGMNNLMKNGVQDGKKSSWNDEQCYRYWFQIEKKYKDGKEIFSVRGRLEFGGNYVKGETFELMQKIRSFSAEQKWGPNKTDIGKYARIISPANIKTFTTDSNGEEIDLETQKQCKSYITTVVNYLLEKETIILDKFKKI